MNIGCYYIVGVPLGVVLGFVFNNSDSGKDVETRRYMLFLDETIDFMIGDGFRNHYILVEMS